MTRLSLNPAIAKSIAMALALSSTASMAEYRYANYSYAEDNYGNERIFSGDTSYTDEARVLRAKPIYETVSINEPETRCWNEQVRHQRPSQYRSHTPTIAGAILGGVVGNQFGGGRGKDAMTVAGAVLGGSLGNDWRNNRSYRNGGSYVTNERRCESVDNFRETTQLVGYNVNYLYNGRDYWTRMSRDPGDTLRVSVSVAPLE